MKYKGKKIEGQNIEIIPIIRPGGNIIFKAEAITGWDKFDKLCPEPIPPTILRPGGEKYPDIKDVKFLKRLEEYSIIRTDWLVLTSLQATQDLEWETVDLENPSTWGGYRKELKESGFNPIEIGRIVRGVMAANALDDDMINAARQDFLQEEGAKGS